MRTGDLALHLKDATGAVTERDGGEGEVVAVDSLVCRRAATTGVCAFRAEPERRKGEPPYFKAEVKRANPVWWDSDDAFFAAS